MYHNEEPTTIGLAHASLLTIDTRFAGSVNTTQPVLAIAGALAVTKMEVRSLGGSG